LENAGYHALPMHSIGALTYGGMEAEVMEGNKIMYLIQYTTLKTQR